MHKYHLYFLFYYLIMVLNFFSFTTFHFSNFFVLWNDLVDEQYHFDSISFFTFSNLILQDHEYATNNYVKFDLQYNLINYFESSVVFVLKIDH